MLSFTADGLVSTFAIVTALFAFLYHKGIRINESFNFDELPPVPKKNELIPKWESVSNIVFNLIVCVLFLFTPQVFSVIHNGTAVCLLDLEAVHSSWLLILLFTVCGIGREVVQLMEGRYNRKVMLAALGCDAVSAVLSCWWVLGFGLLNPEFIANVERIFEGDSGIVSQMFGNFDLFFLGVLLFALVLDAVDVTVKTLKK